MSASGPRQPRQRLRPWLIDQINSCEIEGLVWVDKEQLSFKIPWKHFGRPGIDEYKDALLFRLGYSTLIMETRHLYLSLH